MHTDYFGHLRVLFARVLTFMCNVRHRRALAGTGNITFNGKPAAEYLGYNPSYLTSVTDPLEILGLEATYDVIVKCHGGGVMGTLHHISNVPRTVYV